jgi:hypothetical protein
VFGLKRFLLKEDSSGVPDELVSALEGWRDAAEPSLEEGHFHSRYIVLDLATSGLKPMLCSGWLPVPCIEIWCRQAMHFTSVVRMGAMAKCPMVWMRVS